MRTEAACEAATGQWPKVVIEAGGQEVKAVVIQFHATITWSSYRRPLIIFLSLSMYLFILINYE